MDKENSIVQYYDSDYPSENFGVYPENFDDVVEHQGLKYDVDGYIELTKRYGDPVLEICCGSGRVAIPLGAQGFKVIGIDYSEAMIELGRKNIQRVNSALFKKIDLVLSDARNFDLKRADFKFAFLAFNSLLCLPHFDEQVACLASIAKHLQTGAGLAIDIVNPLLLNFAGDPVPKPFFTRRNVHTGNQYTRFAMTSSINSEHRQTLYGYYDEINPGGAVKRKHYSVAWKPCFRYEIELMLKEIGFKIVSLKGGHRGEQYTEKSPRMFIVAEKSSCCFGHGKLCCNNIPRNLI